MTVRERGRLERDSQGLAMLLDREYPVDRATLWDHLTRPELLGRWFASYEGSPGVGSTIALTMVEDNSQVEHVTVLGCNAPRSFIGEVGRAGQLWLVGFELSDVEPDVADAAASATRMTLRHYLRPGVELTLIGPGWELHLDRLAALLGDSPEPEWDAYFDELTETYRQLETEREASRG